MTSGDKSTPEGLLSTVPCSPVCPSLTLAKALGWALVPCPAQEGPGDVPSPKLARLSNLSSSSLSPSVPYLDINNDPCLVTLHHKVVLLNRMQGCAHLRSAIGCAVNGPRLREL